MKNSINFYKKNKRWQKINTIHINDIWLVKFPYKENGNYFKIRPALVIGFEEENDKIIFQGITSKNKTNKKIEIIPSNFRESFLSTEIICLDDSSIIRKIGVKKGTESKGTYIKNYQFKH